MAAKTYDLLIVGAGPCGLACGIAAQKAGLDYLVIEKGSIAESIRRYPLQMTFFSTAENIEIGGLPMTVTGAKANRSEALQYYRRVAEYYQLHLQLHTTVHSLQKKGDYFEINTSRNETLLAENVVLATGYFDCPRNLNISGETMPHVYKYYDEPFRYVHSKVMIVGGGNSAVEAALDLQSHGVDLTMVIRRDDFKPTAKYWLIPNLRNRIKEGKIKVYFNSEIQRIEKSKVWIKERSKEEEKMLPVDFVFLLIGYTPDIHLIKGSGAEVDDKNLIPKVNPETFESNINGLYVAGTALCGVHTEKIFIENARYDGEKIVRNILYKGRKKTETEKVSPQSIDI